MTGSRLDLVSFPQTIAILGPGILGGSVALALRKRQPASQVRLWARRSEAVVEARGMGIADIVSCDLPEIVTGADLIILATPITVMRALAESVAACDLKPGCLVTDVGSVKAGVLTALEPVFEKTKAVFLGSHPMAGSEQSGIRAARADLFQGAACILTPREGADREAVTRLRSFWQALGCRVLEMSAAVHDERVARISHLPHVMAAVTTLAALRGGRESALDCAAGGFRDTTRVASGDPEMWTGILAGNRAEVLAALADARGALTEVLEILGGMDEEALRRFLQEAKALRDRLPAGKTRHGDD